MAAFSRVSGLVTAFALATLAYGCSPTELPMAPTSAFTAGIILYEHANYLGNSAHLTGDIVDLRDFKGPCAHGDENSSRDWSDCVSSVRVAQGWKATLYRGANFRDDALEITADVPNLQLVQNNCDKGGMNDCVSSVRVRQQ